MKLNESVYEMKSFSPKKNNQQLSLDDIPENVLPNVLNLLGQYTQQGVRIQLPKYSIFYISPLNNVTLYYNSLYFMIFYVMQIQITLTMTLGTTYLDSQYQIIGLDITYWVLWVYFVFDIIVSCHKGFYQQGKGKVCDDHTKIVKNYFRKQAFFDIPSVGFLLVSQLSQNNNIYYFLFIPTILMWVKRWKYQSQIVYILQYKRSVRFFFQITVLFIDVLLIGHYAACIFLAIDIALYNAQYYGSNPFYYFLTNNTSYSVNLVGGLWVYQYIYAQSFATGTLSTLAPGPFVRNPIQVGYALILMIGFMLFASYIGQVLISILYSQQVKRVFHEQNIQDFDKYMLVKQISQNLKTKIYNFLELIWDVQSSMQTQQQKQAINMLPISLKQQLMLEMSFVKNFFLFKYIEDSKIVQKKLAMKITRIILDSDTCLFRQASLTKKSNQQNTLTLNYIYHLARGMLKYYISVSSQHSNQNFSRTSYYDMKNNNISEANSPNSKSKQYIISMSNSDKYVGLYQFITKKSFHHCCVAVDLCQFDLITRKDFMDILKITKNQQTYHKIRHQILYQNKISIINKVCSICYQDHLEESCPSINVKERIKRQLIRDQDNIGRSQERRKNILAQKKNKVYKSRKIYHKKGPMIKKQDNSQIFNFFNKIMPSSAIKLQQLLANLSQMQQIQQCYAWQHYYPQENINRINYTFNVKKVQ